MKRSCQKALEIELDRLASAYGIERPKGYRFFGIDGDGHLHVAGAVPWRMIRSPLRQWLRDWVAKQDIPALEAALGMSVESFSAALQERSSQVRAYLEQEHGKRDGTVAFHIIMEIVVALAHRLGGGNAKLVGRQSIRWEVGSLPNNGGIYQILLKGGQDEKGIHDNPGEQG